MRTIRTGLWAAGISSAIVALVGCDSNPFEDSEDAKTWATSASALAIYSVAYEPIGFADGEATFNDSACPVTSDDGSTLTIEGGCTDAMGRRWEGVATVARAASGDRTLTLDGYGAWDDPGFSATTSGTVVLRVTSATTHDFTADFVTRGGIETTVHYAGSVEGGYDGRSVWNGSGTVARDGFSSATGTVHASTTDETVDDAVCSGQPVSGQTTLEMDGHVAIVTYDGATDCDADRAARLTVDGEDRGLITGVYCTVLAPGASGRARGGLAGVALGCAALALVGGRARRRARVGSRGAARQ